MSAPETGLEGDVDHLAEVRPPRGWALTSVALVGGPGIAFLYERGSLPGSSGGLWSLLPVILVAAAAVAVGVKAAIRGPRWLGYLVVTVNILVVLFYGFFLLFFGLGGSR